MSVNKSLIVDDLRAGSRLVQAAHAAGLDVHCFTLRPENLYLAPANRRGKTSERGRWEEEFTGIFGTGVDGVFADHPDLARQALDALAHEQSAPPAQRIADDGRARQAADRAGG